MNFALKRIYVKSNWFDDGNNKYKKIGYDGFFLYLSLFRFLVNRQDREYTFICSLSLIRKETKYSSQLILDLLKLLVKENVLRVDISRWDRLFDDKGKIIVDKCLTIEALDKPITERKVNGKGEEVDTPVSDDDYYINLDLPLIQYYIDQGLNERYIGLNCLMNRYSNNTEGKSWISINKMADILGFGDKTVNNMIYELNRKYLLYSRYMKTDQKVIGKNGEKESGTKFEHFLLSNLDHMENWLISNKDSIGRNIRKWDKKNKNNKLDEG